MGAVVKPVLPYRPPYGYREYSNDVNPSHKKDLDIFKRVTLIALPFLSLYKPLNSPISLVMSAARTYTFINQLANDKAKLFRHKNYGKISFEVLQTAISVYALTYNVFAHSILQATISASAKALPPILLSQPMGMILTTTHDIIFELRDLIKALKDGNSEASLVSLAKIINNAFYLALICRGGLELSIASYAIQAITLMVLSRDEFRKGHRLEACGNLLMAAVRVNQGYSQVKLLQRQWEIEDAVKRVVVGDLHEKWQFPSDHLPVGIEVDGVKIISWNVLNNAYMEWVTTKDSQGLNGSMISDLNKVVREDGLTKRDLFVVDMVASMMNSGHIIALQECGKPFLKALEERLPLHWEMVKSFEKSRTDQDVILFDQSRLAYRPDQSGVTTDSYPSAPRKPIQNAVFSIRGEDLGRKLRVVNAHIPGDPHLPVREEFAEYVRNSSAYCDHQQVTVALGDNNFERAEMIDAYEKAGFSEFSLHSPWKTNIDPYGEGYDGKYSKAIDHLFVTGGSSSRDLTPEEVLPNSNLKETIALLNGEQSSKLGHTHGFFVITPLVDKVYAFFIQLISNYKN